MEGMAEGGGLRGDEGLSVVWGAVFAFLSFNKIPIQGWFFFLQRLDSLFVQIKRMVQEEKLGSHFVHLNTLEDAAGVCSQRTSFTENGEGITVKQGVLYGS